MGNNIEYYDVEGRGDCIDNYVSQGYSKHQARVECRQDRGGGWLSRPVKKIGLSAPRNSYLALMRLNYRGLASKTYRARTLPENNKAWENIKSKWISLGGNIDSIINASESGKNKKPLFCGSDCKENLKFHNLEPATTASLVASGAAIISSMGDAFSQIKSTQAEKAATQADITTAELDALARQQEQESKTKRLTTIIIGSMIGVSLITISIMAINKFRKRNK